MRTVLRSEDIECGGCTATIEKTLGALPGVTSVSGDPATKLVAVEHDESVSTSELINKMSEAGFEAQVEG